MAWLTVEEFADLVTGSNTSDLPPDAIPNSLQSALNYIRKYVGDAVMSEVEAAAEDSTEPKVTALREAQELLARRKLIQIITGKMREGGIVLRERDENGNTTNEYINAEKAEIKRAALLQDAMDLIEPFILSTATVGIRYAIGGYSATKVVADW